MHPFSITDAASAIAALSAAVAAICAAITVVVHRRATREQRAAESVKKYLELALQHPKIASLNMNDRYDWFVSFMLIMARDVLSAHKRDNSWDLFIRNQMDFFRDDLVAWKKYDKDNKTNYLKQYGSDVERIIEESILRKGAT